MLCCTESFGTRHLHLVTRPNTAEPPQRPLVVDSDREHALAEGSAKELTLLVGSGWELDRGEGKDMEVLQGMQAKWGTWRFRKSAPRPRSKLLCRILWGN